jgi:hypothetical protein
MSVAQKTRILRGLGQIRMAAAGLTPPSLIFSFIFNWLQ